MTKYHVRIVIRERDHFEKYSEDPTPHTIELDMEREPIVTVVVTDASNKKPPHMSVNDIHSWRQGVKY